MQRAAFAFYFVGGGGGHGRNLQKQGSRPCRLVAVSMRQARLLEKWSVQLQHTIVVVIVIDLMLCVSIVVVFILVFHNETRATTPSSPLCVVSIVERLLIVR